jgi:histidinol-phosphatase
MAYERELALAREAAVAAGENAARMQAAGVARETKPDGSPVTAADRENERLIRERIEHAFPNDAIIGEEGTRKSGDSGRRWILDPIDGTRDFVKVRPYWCVLIGLEDQGEAVLGVAHFPMLADTYWASRGGGAYRNGEQLELCGDAMADFLDRLWIARSESAAPKSDSWFERRGELWDLAPLQIIVEEAGGRFFAPDGSRRSDRGKAFACSAEVEAKVRSFLGLK